MKNRRQPRERAPQPARGHLGVGHIVIGDLHANPISFRRPKPPRLRTIEVAHLLLRPLGAKKLRRCVNVLRFSFLYIQYGFGDTRAGGGPLASPQLELIISAGEPIGNSSQGGAGTAGTCDRRGRLAGPGTRSPHQGLRGAHGAADRRRDTGRPARRQPGYRPDSNGAQLLQPRDGCGARKR
jgi:hypothetical protein